MSDLVQLTSAEPKLDEWCTDCKEYDQKRHCCPRWNRVIRETAEEVRQNVQTEQTKMIKEIAENLSRYKCYITAKNGIQHEVIHTQDIKRVTGWEI